MTKLDTKLPKLAQNDQNEQSGYEMTKMVRNDMATKWPWYKMTETRICQCCFVLRLSFFLAFLSFFFFSLIDTV